MKRWKHQIDDYVRKKHNSTANKFCSIAEVFYFRDDVSKMTTGKKQTITSGKVKQQKRLLCDTLQNLHLKFTSEANIKMNYALFCRLRPFWVVRPKESDRETCLCHMHENLQSIATKLKILKIIKTDNTEELLKHIVCDENSKTCMYEQCQNCWLSGFPFETYDGTTQTFWFQRISKTEDREIKKKGKTETKTVTLTVKEKIHGTIDELTDQFQQQLARFRTHVYNIRNQYRCYRHLHDKMNLILPKTM